MGDTAIQWTDKTWNPITGCTQVSPGCDHCYAMTLHNMRHNVYTQNGGSWPNTTKPMPKQYSVPFSQVQLFPDRLEDPLHWRKPQMVFVNSMSDLFHQDIPDEFIQQVFQTMNKAPQHIFQVLTKRPSRAALIANKLTWTSNIWLGTSIENNQYTWRADKLRQVPAAVRFISAEPLLGELTNLNLDGIHWLIAGAESGEGARPMNEDWVRFLRDLCQQYHTAFFYKQNAIRGHKLSLPELDGRQWIEYPKAA